MLMALDVVTPPLEVASPLELAEGSFVVAKAVSFLVQMVVAFNELGGERG